MFGKIIGAAIGAKAAKSVRGGLGGPGGALLGAGAVAVARRLSPMALIAAAAGGYAAKRYYDKRGRRAGEPPKAGPGTT